MAAAAARKAQSAGVGDGLGRPACRLGGLGGGGLPPCTLASWLVLKCWLKITHCLGAATAAGPATAAKGQGSGSWYLPPPWALAIGERCPAGHSRSSCPPVRHVEGKPGQSSRSVWRLVMGHCALCGWLHHGQSWFVGGFWQERSVPALPTAVSWAPGVRALTTFQLSACPVG